VGTLRFRHTSSSRLSCWTTCGTTTPDCWNRRTCSTTLSGNNLKHYSQRCDSSSIKTSRRSATSCRSIYGKWLRNGLKAFWVWCMGIWLRNNQRTTIPCQRKTIPYMESKIPYMKSKTSWSQIPRSEEGKRPEEKYSLAALQKGFNREVQRPWIWCRSRNHIERRLPRASRNQSPKTNLERSLGRVRLQTLNLNTDKFFARKGSS